MIEGRTNVDEAIEVVKMLRKSKVEKVFIAPLLHLISPNFAVPMQASNKHAT